MDGLGTEAARPVVADRRRRAVGSSRAFAELRLSGREETERQIAGGLAPRERARAAATAVSAGLLIKAAEAFPDLFDDSGILLSPVARIAHHLLQVRFRRRTVGTLSVAQQTGFVA